MLDIMARRIGYGKLATFSDDDASALNDFYVNEPLRVKITRASKVKTRAYKELSCYKGSCQYIANMNFNDDMNTQDKVDILTKIRCGFVSDTVYDDKSKRTQWILKSLSYESCDQPESHKFIELALQMHAELVGIKTADEYVRLLNEQK